ncbi:MAG: amidophosphoribosyltransferase [Oscillospiraceae bacterium]|nr:amidophosphoribosyltransferase [Oscillospiraceae bacterium]
MQPLAYRNIDKHLPVLPPKGEIYDECGVFGLYKTDGDEELNGISITHDALLGLQHRGQESAGIAVNNNGEFSTVKDVGMVYSALSEKALEDLPDGKIVIGHVRYTPLNLLDSSGTQPLIIRYIYGALGICHNGALTNFKELKDKLEQGGAIFQSYSDAEMIAYIIAEQRLHAPSIEDAIIKTMHKLRGAYSLVVSSPNKLIAVRDPYGFRPLCLGKIGNSYCFASESCVFQSVGAEFIRDICPGEIVVVDSKGINSYFAYEQNAENKTSLCMFEYVYIARPDSVIDGISVYNARKRAGELLYLEHPVDADMVCGVPDSGLDAAQGYAAASKIPYGIAFIKNKYIARMVSMPQKEKKKRLLNTKLTALAANVKGKRIVIIDDSIVRGETSKHIVTLLKNAGAKEVHMRISSPPFLHACYFGVDVKNEDELIAKRMNTQQIAEYLGVDSLGYLSCESLNLIAQGAKVGFCDACFSGKYPLEIPKEIFVDKFSEKIRFTEK